MTINTNTPPQTILPRATTRSVSEFFYLICSSRILLTCQIDGRNQYHIYQALVIAECNRLVGLKKAVSRC